MKLKYDIVYLKSKYSNYRLIKKIRRIELISPDKTPDLPADDSYQHVSKALNNKHSERSTH